MTPLNPQEQKSIIEAILFVTGDEGVEVGQLAEVLETDTKQVQALLEQMQREYREQRRGMQMIELAGSYQLTTLPEHAVYFQKLAYTPSRGTLSQAALETLAIIAYKQPLTRVEIEEIRGVKSDRAIQTLVAKQLIEAVGRAEAVGRPILYGTTKSFLDYFGLSSLSDLPKWDEKDDPDQLETESQLLYEKLERKQITIDDLENDTV